MAVLWGSPAQARTVSYFYTDPQGTVVATTDALGNLISGNDYRPFGEPALGTDQAGPAYTGHVRDDESALNYMIARYQDPTTGRFVSIDPAPPTPGQLFEFNRFAYARNSPYKYTDPDGRNAIITHRSDGSIDIKVPIIFSGNPDANNAANVAAIKSDVASRWSGLYNVGGSITKVSVSVVDVDSNTPKNVINKITLLAGITSNRNSAGASFVREGKEGEWNVLSPGMKSGEAAHEAGHLMMIADHYHETVDATGTRVTVPDAGYESNLMGALGAKVLTDYRDLDEAFQSQKNINATERAENP